MLIFQIKRIISSEKWFNYVVTFFFCFENAKNLGGSDDAKRRKKREWSYTITVFVLTFRLPKERGNKTVKFTAALPLVPRLEDMFYSDIG